jgi:hypothetical protein
MYENSAGFPLIRSQIMAVVVVEAGRVNMVF